MASSSKDPGPAPPNNFNNFLDEKPFISEQNVQAWETVRKPKRPVNSWMAFRSYYSHIFTSFQQKDISGILTYLWSNEPFKAKWSILAKAYSMVRDVLGKEKAPLDVFLALNAPFVGIISPQLYIAALGYEIGLGTNEEPYIFRPETVVINTMNAEIMNASHTVHDVLQHSYQEGLIPEDGGGFQLQRQGDDPAVVQISQEMMTAAMAPAPVAAQPNPSPMAQQMLVEAVMQTEAHVAMQHGDPATAQQVIDFEDQDQPPVPAPAMAHAMAQQMLAVLDPVQTPAAATPNVAAPNPHAMAQQMMVEVLGQAPGPVQHPLPPAMAMAHQMLLQVLNQSQAYPHHQIPQGTNMAQQMLNEVIDQAPVAQQQHHPQGMAQQMMNEIIGQAPVAPQQPHPQGMAQQMLEEVLGQVPTPALPMAHTPAQFPQNDTVATHQEQESEQSVDEDMEDEDFDSESEMSDFMDTDFDFGGINDQFAGNHANANNTDGDDGFLFTYPFNGHFHPEDAPPFVFEPFDGDRFDPLDLGMNLDNLIDFQTFETSTEMPNLLR
ncbi:MAG: hypothetical protein M4579_007412 [Chaenotheca gracillima]|nr:MAG: hypothetical protein M4579_007412 [Chaenotheca gracillima]